MPDVIDNHTEGRFELQEDGHTAELAYRVEPGRLVLIHTGVPDELGGRGVGGKLVQAGLERAKRDGLTVVPVCEFARGWIEKHPGATDGVKVDVSGL